MSETTAIHPDDLGEIMKTLESIASALERSADAHERQVEALESIGESLDRLYVVFNEWPGPT
jgi:hypothetical protein